MPLTLAKAPNNLPKHAQEIYIAAFNAAFENCEGDEAECDEKAARIAWGAVKSKYIKRGDSWIMKKSDLRDAYNEIELHITKASVQPDGRARWQVVASDTGLDRVDERTSTTLFRDWIERIEKGLVTPFLPSPTMPFLGVSHYPALDGEGEAGITERMFIDGDRFKADGSFLTDPQHSVGTALFEAIRTERALIKKGEPIETPIRISAGWWDLQHQHGEFVFTRRSLADRCPMCDQGVKDKFYSKGQLDHFAATRVPMNPRTSIDIEEKSMNKKTRKEDAESIIGGDLAARLDEKVRLVGKSESTDTWVASADEFPEAMVIRASKIGDFIKRKREEMEMSISELADKTPVTESTISSIEQGEIETPSIPVLNAIAKALKVSATSLRGMLPAGAMPADEVGTTKAMMKTIEGEEYPASDFLVVEDPESPSTWHLQIKRNGEVDHRLMGAAWAALHGGYRGNKYEGPEKGKAIDKLKKIYEAEEMPTPTTKMMDHDDMGQPPMRPFGGATSIEDAEGYLESHEKMRKLYSNWDILNQVAGNILADEEMAAGDKVEALSAAIGGFSSRIDTLKSSLADAFMLVQSDTGAEQEPDLEETEVEGSNPMGLEETVTAVMADGKLNKTQKANAIQEAFESYAQTVRAQLDGEPTPMPDPAQAIKGAVAEALAPFTEQLGLLVARLGQPAVQQVQPPLTIYHLPQQKSLAGGYQPQPVQAAQPDLPISPITGKPSALTAALRRSTGIVE